MNSLWIALIVFGLLIFIHELGHFLAAKRVGIDVLEFGIGFGPKIFTFQRQETRYTLRLLPLGGFVRMAGTDPDDIDNENGFAKKSVGKRMGVIVAGATMNFLLAMVMFGLLVSLTGIPTGEFSDEARIGEIIIGEPADLAGLLPGDLVLSVDGEPVQNWTDLVAVINANPNQPLSLVIERDEIEKTLTVTPKMRDEDSKGVIGITGTYLVRPATIIEQIRFGIQQTFFVAGLILNAIWQMITGKMAADISGPIAITRVLGRAARLGFPYLLNLAAIININIGLFNLIPIPALDGSRLVFLAIEGIRGKPVAQDKENMFHIIGFALLMLLAIFVAYRDILNIGRM